MSLIRTRNPQGLFSTMLKRVAFCGIGALALCAGVASPPVQAATYSNTSITYNWISPAAHTSVPWTNGAACSGGGSAGQDDDITSLINIGFTFNFGGVDYTQVRVMTNGRLQFNNNWCGFGTQAIGNNTAGNPRTYTMPYPNANLVRTMKVYGADIDMSNPGSGTTCAPATCHVRYTSSPLGTAPNRYFVVTWTNVPDWNSSGSSYSMQVILYENGEFVYQYGAPPDVPAMANPDFGQAQIGWEVDTTDYNVVPYTQINPAATYIPDLGGFAVRFYIPVYAEYRMDEAVGTWGAGNILDSSGNSHHGAKVGNANAIFPGRLCNGGNIPLNTTPDTVVDAVDTGFKPADIGSAGTVTFWYKSATNWNDGKARMLLDASRDNGNGNADKHFFVQKNTNGAIRFALEDSADADSTATTGGLSFTAGSWHHIGITWNIGASRLSIYVDGSLAVTSTTTLNGSLPAVGSQNTFLIGDANSGNVGSAPGRTPNSANGVIDEVRFYAFEGGIGLIQGDRSATRPGCIALDHFRITAPSGVSACGNPNRILIAAEDVNNNVIAYTGTVALSTSVTNANKGTWGLGAGTGSLTGVVVNGGAANYQFGTADGGVAPLDLTFSGTLATPTSPFTITANDTNLGISSVSGSITVTTASNTFQITAPDVLGTTVVANRPHAMRVTKLSSCNPVTTDTAYTGAKTVATSISRTGGVDPGGAAPNIGGINIPNAPTTANVNLTFTAGVANFNLGTSDVGSYSLNMTEGARNGSSQTLTVRPFGIGFTNIRQPLPILINNPGGTATSGAKFIPASDNFAATVGGYRYAAGEDTITPGTPDPSADITDNGLTPSFAWDTVVTASTAPADYTPNGGGATAGTIGLTVAKSSFSGGAADVLNFQYSEVGSMKMQGDVSGYLSAPVEVTGKSGAVGRFYPDHFTLLPSSGITPYCGGAGGVSYMDQPNLLTFSIEARSKIDGKTNNYDNATRGYGLTGAVAMQAENNNDGVNLGSRVSIPAAMWNTGTYTVGTGSFGRNPAPDGPYDQLRIGAQVTDPDGAVLQSRDMNPTTNTDCVALGNCTGKTLGPDVKLRFGRLRLSNAYGSSLIDLPVRMETQYWNGTAFAANTLDSCTTLALSDVVLGNYQKNLNACETILSPAISFLMGVASPKLTKPGSANNGSVDWTVNLDSAATGNTCLTVGGAESPATAANRPYLQGKWSGASYNQNPTARATFGVHKGASEFIYLRENY